MKVDILMATYNGEKYIKEQIESILNQTHTNFNLHISDDLSTDNTRDILTEYANKDKRIKLHFQKNNIGYIKNFEYLISISKAKYKMLTDQDDVWLEDKVEITLNKMLTDKLNLVITDLIVVDKELNMIKPSYFDFIDVKPNNNINIGSYLLRNPATGCTMMFDNYLAQKMLPFPALVHPYYVHDWYIIMIGQAYGKVGYINKPLSKYRQHGNNSIGMHRTKKRSFDFIRTARYINIKYRIDFCNQLLKKINNKSKKEIIEFRNYLKGLEKTKFINFDFKTYIKYSKLVGFKTRLRFLLVFHFPLFFLSKKIGEKNG